MTRDRDTSRARRAGVLAAVAVALLATTAAAEASADADADTATAAAVAVRFDDPTGDVAKHKLDLTGVRVTNGPDQLTVRVTFPGVTRTYGFPLGYVSVHLDTDPGRPGPEFGHFMQFWSDYRFSPTQGWRELPSPPWQHSPDGRCVADAGLRSDPRHRLHWIEYVVQKREGCFEADAVRVAVTTANEGENHPYRPFDHPFYDYLGAEHSWTPWVPVS